MSLCPMILQNSAIRSLDIRDGTQRKGACRGFLDFSGLTLAFVLSALVGVEREIRQKNQASFGSGQNTIEG